MSTKKLEARHCVLFFDFDNTITSKDIFDDMLVRFSPGRQWEALEKKWQEGSIGSEQCLKGQLEHMELEKASLDRYLKSIRIDFWYGRLVSLLKAKRVPAFIVSDNFDYILTRIIRSEGSGSIKIFANTMRVLGKKTVVRFPYRHPHCHRCAHCKTKNILAHTRADSIIIYVGDGRSDICPALCSDIVFAKGELLGYFRKARIPAIPFKNLKDVYAYLKGYLS
ncbi:MAG: MtnX-like HAD-IB family phosphatase [Candidatus Omnitrophica bacterium]|nr:MtnX-like HAD-IB family phosphatase [Candidatus Omnitrophota bacterium]